MSYRLWRSEIVVDSWVTTYQSQDVRLRILDSQNPRKPHAVLIRRGMVKDQKRTNARTLTWGGTAIPHPTGSPPRRSSTCSASWRPERRRPVTKR
jgi:hypothetical protein